MNNAVSNLKLNQTTIAKAKFAAVWATGVFAVTTALPLIVGFPYEVRHPVATVVVGAVSCVLVGFLVASVNSRKKSHTAL